MGLPSRIHPVVAWIVVALVVAWAPLFHAICIAPAESAAATHVMADGTVMTTAVSSGETGHAGHAAGADPVEVTAAAVTSSGVAAVAGILSEAVDIAGPSVALLDSTAVVGVIVVFAGVAVLAFAMFARRCRLLPARGDPPGRRSPPPSWRDIRVRRPTDVDLHRLGISRT